MGSIWESIGFTRWPISFCLAVLVLLGLWSVFKLFRTGASPDLRTKAWLDGVLVWGFLGFLFGLLGAVVGIIVTLQAIEAAGAVRATVMAPGIKSTLLSSGFGTVTRGIALFLWYVLQLRWRLLEAASATTHD
jgi:hypothetical protein